MKKMMILSAVLIALGLSSVPAQAKHHQGEKPEAVHKQKGKSTKTKSAATPKADDKGKHAEPGDDRGAARHGKDDGPNHK